jgi:peptidoglycan/LPS O-acetylase OafA/YrhL
MDQRQVEPVPQGGGGPGGRFSNNFDFMRFAAATLVVAAHAYALHTGYSQIGLHDPVMLAGRAALAALLATSGYLIAASWESTASPLRFAWKRFLRVVPGLIPVILVTLFILGPLVTSLPQDDYFAALLSPEGLAAVPFFENGGVLGLFQDNPVAYVNGSLWTIPLEAALYGVVAALGVAGLLHRRGALPALIALSVLVWFCWFDDVRMAKVRFSLYFLLGALLYLRRERVTLRPAIAGGLLILLVASAMTPFAAIAGVVAIPYLTIYAAHIPLPLLNTFGRHGDFSYGIYLYHYPLQQTIIQVTANTVAIPALFGISFAAAFACAFISWHAIERRALAAKNLRASDLRRALGLSPRPEPFGR